MRPQPHPESPVEGFFRFDPEAPLYREHFPGNPVVPGTLIIHAFLELLEPTGPWQPRRFRFLRFVPPGEYRYTVEPVEPGRVRCCLWRDGTAAVRGECVR